MKLFTLIAVLACALPLHPGRAQNPDSSASRQTPDSVRRYLVAALDTLQRVSLHRDSVNWTALRDSVFARTAGARTSEETWRTLQWALRRVDRHSFLQTPRPMPPLPGAAAPSPAATSRNNRPPAVTGRMVDGRVGYLLVPWFPGSPRASYVDSLQTLVREFDTTGACGWIVDLRGNGGGNMWPMLAGIGPLLGDSIVGSFVVQGEPDAPWRYVNGHAWSGPATMPEWNAHGSLPPVTLRVQLAPVAVLTDSVTASSGEATLIAFRGRPNMRSFGTPTAGFASVNNGYQLSDSANMVITIGYERDRTGYQYPLTIQPDELVVRSKDDAADEVLLRASKWVREQQACTR
ncbi:MAG: S41 family peptidase [Gemmatimonadaceae bacterium]